MQQIAAFFGLNLVVMPPVVLIYVTVVSKGLEITLPVLGTKLYRTGFPGIGALKQYDGFDRLTIATLMSLVLCIVLLMTYKKLFELLQSPGQLKLLRSENPVLFTIVAGIFSTVILADGAAFYAGVASELNSSWGSETSGAIPAVATVLYAATLASISLWHHDYFKTESV